MSEPGVGRFVVAFSLQGVVFILLLFVIELQCVCTIRRLFSILCRRRKQVAEGSAVCSSFFIIFSLSTCRSQGEAASVVLKYIQTESLKTAWVAQPQSVL